MALEFIEPTVQVKKVAKLLGLVAIRLKRERLSKSFESSRKFGKTALDISSPAVITVSRSNDLATGETGCNENYQGYGDSLERKTTRSDRNPIGASYSTHSGQESGEGSQARRGDEAKQCGGDR